MDWIMIPLNCLIVFGTIYKVVELFVRKRERLTLISKLTEISNVDFKGIKLYNSGNKFTALRFAWLLMGVGLGFFVGFFLNFVSASGNLETLTEWQFMNKIGGIIYVSSISFFGGLGLLISYYTERKAEQTEDKKNDDNQI
ncbi:DUF6249 domain-containing protein [Xylanibacter brevis]|uniref:DUF6249 domain-containing protein n=1 Tax=Xylanibacter brevis TaxID=83231 RepID=UPI000481B9C5|nr:DUF6249 domain-containing protein [Xylanibacter brevis]